MLDVDGGGNGRTALIPTGMTIAVTIHPPGSSELPGGLANHCCGRLSAGRDALLAAPHPVCPHYSIGSTAVPRSPFTVSC
ncbi:MAG: hypothetical protein IPJ94_03380 [Chloroflexi bacterium]|nr:hypothetical protein [Chloroflexota bacterium]